MLATACRVVVRVAVALAPRRHLGAAAAVMRVAPVLGVLARRRRAAQGRRRRHRAGVAEGGEKRQQVRDADLAAAVDVLRRCARRAEGREQKEQVD